MRTSLAIVHHANQYLITTGYDNREGIEAILGEHGGQSGFRWNGSEGQRRQRRAAKELTCSGNWGLRRLLE